MNLKRLGAALVARTPDLRRRPLEPLTILMKAYNSDQPGPRLLYLGDSTLLRVAREDIDSTPLGEKVVARLHGTPHAVWLAHSGYNPSLYVLLVRATLVMRLQPKVILVPINLRCFSPQWMLNPKHRNSEHRQVLKQYRGGNRQYRVRERQPTGAEWRRFLEEDLPFAGVGITTVREFEAIRRARSTTDEGCARRLAALLAVHYMYVLERGNPELAALEELATLCRSEGIRLCCYLTPVNHDAGRRYLGHAFGARLEQNARTAEAAANKAGAEAIIDLSTYLRSDGFFHPDDTTEHLNEGGRSRLTGRLVSFLGARDLPPDSARPTQTLARGGVSPPKSSPPSTLG